MVRLRVANVAGETTEVQIGGSREWTANQLRILIATQLPERPPHTLIRLLVPTDDNPYGVDIGSWARGEEDLSPSSRGGKWCVYHPEFDAVSPEASAEQPDGFVGPGTAQEDLHGPRGNRNGNNGGNIFPDGEAAAPGGENADQQEPVGMNQQDEGTTGGGTRAGEDAEEERQNSSRSAYDLNMNYILDLVYSEASAGPSSPAGRTKIENLVRLAPLCPTDVVVDLERLAASSSAGRDAAAISAGGRGLGEQDPPAEEQSGESLPLPHLRYVVTNRGPSGGANSASGAPKTFFPMVDGTQEVD